MSPSEWTAEIEVDERLVRDALAEQFPTLVGATVKPLATGWDNSVWLVDDKLVFRFPRRRIALAGIEREIAVLPRLAPRLPLPVPTPSHVGQPSERFPWPFFGAPLIHGEEPADLGLLAGSHSLGSALGGFLRALHDRHLVDAFQEQLPVDPMGRADMRLRVPRTRVQLAALVSVGAWSVPPKVDEFLSHAETLPASGERSLVHGDLHVRHVLVNARGQATGIIDWGDICMGDPAIDLSLYWSLLDTRGRRAFRSAYGSIGSDALSRARVLALFLNSALALYAMDVGNDSLASQALAGLDRTLDER